MNPNQINKASGINGPKQIDGINGIINVLKPPGMTSHDVVKHLRRQLKVKKTGHTGTLDPGVAGVLPVCLGRATKVVEYMADDLKQYRTEVTFGRATDTQDGFGQTLEVKDASGLSQTEVVNALKRLVGVNQQIPPMVSAVKYKGRKLYELARQGIEIEREPRTITIHEIYIVECKGFGTPNPTVLFDIKCSKGTYVRTICHDLGQDLGYGAFMSFLVRTGTGSFHITEALTLEEISDIYESGRIRDVVLPLDRALPFETVWVADQAVSPVLHGNRLDESKLVSRPRQLRENQLVKLVNQEAGCLAVAKVSFEPVDASQYPNDADRLLLQPVKVFG